MHLGNYCLNCLFHKEPSCLEVSYTRATVCYLDSFVSHFTLLLHMCMRGNKSFQHRSKL